MIIRVEPSAATISEQFVAELDQLADIREHRDDSKGTEAFYQIRPQFGTGSVCVYRLMDGMMLTLFDAEFHEDVFMEFRLPAEHFEIEYCISGSLGVQIGSAPEQIFRRNAISVSTSREECGRLRHIAGQRYQCVSLTAHTDSIAAYLGSAGAPLWQDTFETLSAKKRTDYFVGVEASRETAACFHDMLNCSLPHRMKPLFFEGKVMEILSRLIACDNAERQEEERLDEFEKQQIRKVPGMLADNLFALPTIAELSRQLALNRNKLMWGFKQLFEDTIYGYHRKMCLGHAAMLLSRSRSAVHEIALDVGYSSASNFCSAFKREYGMTPIQYRLESQNSPTEKGQIAT